MRDISLGLLSSSNENSVKNDCGDFFGTTVALLCLGGAIIINYGNNVTVDGLFFRFCNYSIISVILISSAIPTSIEEKTDIFFSISINA